MPKSKTVNNLQICYLPYLFLGSKKAVDFAEMNVWNFGLLGSERIHDGELRNHVIELLSSNRRNGVPIQDIGIISFRNRKLFQPLTQREYRRVDELRKVLFLSSVAKSNINDGPNMAMFFVTSDNFTALYQNFALGSNDTAYSSGKIIRVGSVGHQIGEIVYEMPRYVLYKTFEYDQELLRALSRLNRKKPRIFRLIIRATDAMMNGYSNSDDVSYESRILEQSRAFEILLQLPDRFPRKVLKEIIEKYCKPAGERNLRYKYEGRKGKVNCEKNKSCSRQAMWADRFYTLRNHIIHGERINAKEFIFSGQLHYHLALWFFLVSVKKIINEAFDKIIFHDVIRHEDGKFEYDKQSRLPIIERIVNRMIHKRNRK